MRKIVMGMLGLVLCGMDAVAEDLVIDSLESTGELSFTEITNATSYRVEWAPSPGGPWATSWQALNFMPASGSGSVTCSVAMCYRVVAELGIAMVQIPAGSNSGTNPLGTGEAYEQGYPATYSLTVDSFFMDVTSVTQTQWDNVYNWANSNGYIFDNTGSGKGVNHPVHSVNWYDCVKWCNARSEKEGLVPCYTVSNAVFRVGQFSPDCDFEAEGYRLPTTEEWEYAARGGLGSRRFPWGDTIAHTNTNYRSTSISDYDVSLTSGYHPDYHTDSMPYTAPVGSFSPNGYGVYDLVGNMTTWCWEAKFAMARECRGGTWIASAEAARCGRINWQLATDSVTTSGLRAVRR